MNLKEIEEKFENKNLNNSITTSIVWISNILNYCQYEQEEEEGIKEEEKKSKLEQDIIEFQNFVNSVMNDENSIPIHLCLNMKDLLDENLKYYPIKNYLKTIKLNDEKNKNEILNEISKLYVKNLQRNQKIFIHSTSFSNSIKESKELINCILKNLKNTKFECECESKIFQFQFISPKIFEIKDDYF